jgi:superfamily II DNA or RNA helicase
MAADVVIEKKNEVYIKLNCEPHILYELQPYFTFTLESAKFMPQFRKTGWNGTISLLSTATGEIYAGLLDRVIAKLKAHGYGYEFKENRFYGLPFEINPEASSEGTQGYLTAILKNSSPKVNPYDYQINAVYECLKFNRKTIISPTASGKTLLIYALARYYTAKKLKTLIIFPTTSLIHQTVKNFCEYGWDPENHCHMIYSGQEKNSNMPVILSTWQSLTRMNKSFFEDIDCVIGDEVHQYKSKSLIDIMKKCHNAKYRFGFTGTLSNGGKDSQTHELVIAGLFGPTYKTINTKEMIEKGRASQLDINCIVLKHESKRFDTYEEEIQYLISNEKRNNFIKNLALDLKGNTLILFSRVESHGQPIYDLINSFNESDRKIFFVHGKVDVEDREKVREITERENNAIIVASYGVFSTGISINNLHNIIFASPSKSRIRTLQSIGRVLRKGSNKDRARLYDIADDCTIKNRKNYTLNHFIERIRIYNEEEFDYDIVQIDFKE